MYTNTAHAEKLAKVELTLQQAAVRRLQVLESKRKHAAKSANRHAPPPPSIGAASAASVRDFAQDLPG